MKSTPHAIFLAALLAVGMLAQAPLAAFAEDKAEAQVVAKVNGKDLTESDMQLAEAEIGRDLGNLPPAVKRRALLDFLIKNELFADAAESSQVAAGSDLDQRMSYWKRRSLREIYFNKTIKPSISEATAKAFYDDQVKMLPPEDEVQARHILVETEATAKELADKIAAGADFAEVAKEFSKDPGTKDEGGLLGFFAKGQMVPQFEEAAFKLKKGEVSPPVQSQFGWHLIKVEDRRPRQVLTFDQAKERILNSMIYDKAQAVAAELRGKAQIEYVDPELKKAADEQAKHAAGPESMLEEQIKIQEDQKKADEAIAKDAATTPAAEAPKP